MRKLPSVVNATVLTLSLIAPAFGDDWAPVYLSDELRVERREYRGSPLEEIRGVTLLDASVRAALALLRDADFNRQWVYRSGGATILEEHGDSQAYVYGIVDAPWPMQDRDAVVRFDSQLQPETGEITITITNFPDFIPERAEYVRVPEFGGFWKLRPLDNYTVEVTYQVHGDPGGWVPVWLANIAAQTSVRRTLENMRRVVAGYEGGEAPAGSGDID